jgi:Domain of unknown function (DUF1883)
MKYAYLDLGRQEAGGTVEVKIRGAATNVLLLDVANFLRYQADRSFRYSGGGRYRGRPVRIGIPRDDHWFVVLELGTYNGRARATVELLPAGSGQEPQRTLVKA